MDLAKARVLIGQLAAERGCLLYSGSFTDGVSASLIALAEGLCSGAGRERAHRQRLAFVMVEAYQNVVRHRVRLPSAEAAGPGRSLFLMRMHRQSDEVVTVNPVAMEEKATLDALLGQIGQSDLAQLKALFLARLGDGGRTARGGAGLGLIEMARRSANGLGHAWLMGAAHPLLLLHMRIGAGVPPMTADEAASLQRSVSELNVLIACRCGASAAALEAVVRMLEAEPLSGARMARAILAGAAWLRENGQQANASIVVLRHHGRPFIVIGLDAGSSGLQEMHAQVLRIAVLSPAQRSSAYRKALLRSDTAANREADLLELAHLSGGADPLVHQAADGQLLIAVPLE